MKLVLPKLIVSLTLIFFFGIFLSQHSHLFAQEQRDLSVSAVVPPSSADYQFSYASTDGKTNVPQNETLDYQITYGASSSAGVNSTTTIVADFSDDVAPGGSHVLDYVIGSASNAYGGTQPVVDLLNRTITWTIPAFPAGTINQTVTFQLKTNDNYTGATTVSFTTQATFDNDYVSFSGHTVTQSYTYNAGLVTPTPTPSPTTAPGPTATPGPQPTATPGPSATPTPIKPNPLQIIDVTFETITQSTATIAVTTNKPAATTISFGTSAANLNKTSQTSGLSTYSLVDLPNLTPATTYYFRVTVKDASGNSLRSEIFTFDTAEKSQTTLDQNDAVAITSEGKILLSDIFNPTRASSAFVLLPTGTNYHLAYTFGTNPSVSSMEVIIRNAAGIDRRVNMTSRNSRTYVAQLRSGDRGTYEIIVVQTDEKGNIVSRKVSNLKIISPLQVRELGSDTPIGDARVLLKSLDGKDLSAIINPSFTDSNGEDKFLLLPGRYRVEVSAFGHKSKAVDFTLGEREGEEYPTIHLKSDMFDLTYLIQILRDDLIKILVGIITAIKELASSIRAFHIAAMTILLALVSLAFLLFHIRTNVWTREILPFFLFYFAFVRKKHKERYLFGYILDENGNPVANARVEVMEHNAQTAIEHTTSTKAGSFRLPNIFKEPYVILLITKDGHPVVRMAIPTDTKKTIIVRMKKETPKAAPVVLAGIKHVAGGFFEIALILSLISELLFIEAFGVARTLPFIALSLFNLALWIFYQKEHTRQL